MSIGQMAALVASYAVVLVIIAVIWVIANWKIYTKAGEAGWKSIIPIYNMFVLYKFTWNTTMFWAFLVLGVVGNCIGSFGQGGIVSAIQSICVLAVAVINVIQANKEAKAFGHGIGFTLGLIFLNPIFVLILAFGSSEYKGIQ